jgi:predicted Zn-ribbon and HTH transcriptional regulator
MTRARKRKEPVPAERGETLRQSIRALLAGPPLSLKEISGEVRISEKEVLGHLEHLERSLPNLGCALAVEPAECGRCGFVFSKRERLKKPGRCPVCRGEVIHEPLFSVRGRD